MTRSASGPKGNAIRGGDVRSVGGRWLDGREWREVANQLGLSARERQIVKRIFGDASEAAIAKDLGISPHTVHTHLERLYHKLGVGSRCAVVVRIFAAYRALRDSGRLQNPDVSGR